LRARALLDFNSASAMYRKFESSVGRRASVIETEKRRSDVTNDSLPGALRIVLASANGNPDVWMLLVALARRQRESHDTTRERERERYV
jgi:hypothetical protein